MNRTLTGLLGGFLAWVLIASPALADDDRRDWQKDARKWQREQQKRLEKQAREERKQFERWADEESKRRRQFERDLRKWDDRRPSYYPGSPWGQPGYGPVPSGLPWWYQPNGPAYPPFPYRR